MIDLSRPKPTTTTIRSTRGRHGERVARGVSSLPVEGDESMEPSRWNDKAKVKHPRAEHEKGKEQDAFDALVALEGLLWEWWGLLATHEKDVGIRLDSLLSTHPTQRALPIPRPIVSTTTCAFVRLAGMSTS